MKSPTAFDDFTPPELEVIQGIRRGRVDIAIASLLSDAGLRRSAAAAVTWADIARAADGSGRVTVRRSKTDQAGQGAILYVTAATMAALDAIRQGAPDAAPVFGLSAGQIGRRIAAAAGLGGGYSGHSGRGGLAVRTTAKGAPTHAVMLAGRWQGAGMVARYTRALTRDSEKMTAHPSGSVRKRR